MTRLTLIIALVVAGCVQGGSFPDPAQPVTPDFVSPDAKPQPLPTGGWTVDRDAALESLALWVEAGRCESTDRLLKVCGRTIGENGLSFPADYDLTMKQFLDKNVPLTADLQRDAAKKLRGFKGGAKTP